jgi:hypothetical protein
MAGMILGLFTVVQAVVAFFLYGTLDSTVFASEVGAFLTMILNGVFFPEYMTESYYLDLGISLVFVLIGLVISAFVMGSVIKFALDDIATGKPNIGVSVSTGIKGLLPLVVIQFIISILSGALLAPGQAFMAYGIEYDNIEFMTNGLTLFFILGLISVVLLVRIIASPALIVDRDMGSLDSLNKSFEMSRGRTIPIVLAWVLVAVVVFILDFMISFMFSILLLSLGTEITLFVVTFLNKLLLAPISYIFYTVVYVDLEIRTSA